MIKSPNPIQSGRNQVGVFWVALILMLASCAAAPLREGPSDSEASGRRVAEIYCSRCHAIGQTDESEVPRAPPLRSITERMNLLSLRSHLRRADPPVPPEMGRMELTDRDIETLSAYLQTLR